jgi:hypothetical protein
VGSEEEEEEKERYNDCDFAQRATSSYKRSIWQRRGGRVLLYPGVEALGHSTAQAVTVYGVALACQSKVDEDDQSGTGRWCFQAEQGREECGSAGLRLFCDGDGGLRFLCPRAEKARFATASVSRC